MKKAQSTGNKYKRGMSTLEILIAFAILILCISAVIMVVFGNQSIAVDSETNNEAISKAQRIVEIARAKSREDFNSVNTESLPDEDIYHLDQEVTDLTQCKKEIIGTVSWDIGGRTLSVDFSTFLSDIAGALMMGGDCTIDPPGTDWSNPQRYTSADIIPGGNEGTDIDAMKIDGHKYAFLTSVHNSVASDDFWVFDVEVGFEVEPPTVGQLDVGAGLNAIDVARDINSGEIYAYVLENDNVNQLKVIKVTDPGIPTLIASASRTLPNMNHTCSPPVSPCLAGQSIYFYDGYIYIGTDYIQNLVAPPFQNNELHVYCVSNISVPGCSPSNPIWLGSYNVNHNVNSITIVDKTAYLATSWDDQELTILNVEEADNISPLDDFEAIGDEDGTSVTILGNKIYVGRKQTASSRPELYILEKSDLSVKKEIDLNLSPADASVADIVVVSRFIFLGTGDSNAEFQVWNSDDLTSRWSDFDFPQAITGLEFLDDKIYAAVKSNDALHIIYDEP